MTIDETYSNSSLKINFDADMNVFFCGSVLLSLLSFRFDESRLAFKLFDRMFAILTAIIQYWSLINMSTIGFV
jgi:hypothetical protein